MQGDDAAAREDKQVTDLQVARETFSEASERGLFLVVRARIRQGGGNITRCGDSAQEPHLV